MNLFGGSIIFVLVNLTISSGEPYALLKDREDAPLALIKKHNPSRLELAIPQKSKLKTTYGQDYYADYAYDASINEGEPVEEFMMACRAQSHIIAERDIEKNWKRSNRMPEYVRLFILDEYKKADYQCSYDATPAIKKVEVKNDAGEVKYCGQSEAEIYNVGFWVSDREGEEVKFVPVYKICYSIAKGKGMLYSVHRIESPTLLLQEVWEYYELKPEDGMVYQSVLDKNDDSENIYDNQYAYQIVPMEDMPLKNWATTTLFTFNYIPITLNNILMKDMLAVNNYIRLFSKKTDKPLTLYSGIHQRVVDQALDSAVRNPHSSPESVNSFWKIIINDEGLATMIVIQHTAGMKCDDDTFLCDDEEEPVILKDYEKNGCIYTCSVNSEVIERLGLPRDEEIEQFELPRLKINGDLFLIFPRERKGGSKASENEKKVPAKRRPKYVSISEFLGEVSFKSALENVDSDLAFSVKVHEKTEDHDNGLVKPYEDGGGEGAGGLGGSGEGFEGD